MREEAGLTQADLAARLNLHQSFVSKYEAGERRVDLYEASLIGRALGSSLVALATRLAVIWDVDA